MPRASSDRIVSRGARHQSFKPFVAQRGGERDPTSVSSTPVAGPSTSVAAALAEDSWDDPGPLARFYAQRYGHLSASDAIDLILHDEEVRKEHEKFVRNPTKYIHIPPVVPRRKPLPPSVPSTVPLTRQELRDRITPRPAPLPLAARIESPAPAPAPLPISQRPAIGFEKVSASELAGIYSTRIRATLTRVTAIAEQKEKLADVPRDQYRALERLVESLLWARRHVEEIGDWQKKEIDALKWGLKQIGTVSFTSLKRRFAEIVKALAEVEGQGYFDWIQKADTFPV